MRELIGENSVSAFARSVGLPEANVRTYLTGRKPSIEKVVQIADACGVTVDWLAAGRESKRRREQHAEEEEARAVARDEPGIDVQPQSVADRIRIWRQALGLTQGQFADRTEIPRRTLIGYENEERFPGGGSLTAIAHTGVNMNWLLTGEGEMVPHGASGGDGRTEGQEGHADDQATKRWDRLIELVEGIEDDDRRAAAMQDLFARAQEMAELDELRRAVSDLKNCAG